MHELQRVREREAPEFAGGVLGHTERSIARPKRT